MAAKNARTLLPGDRVYWDGDQHDVIRIVQVIAHLASGRVMVYNLPAEVELAPEAEELDEDLLHEIRSLDEPPEDNGA